MKLLSISIVIFLILSGFGAGAIHFDVTNTEALPVTTTSVEFSSLHIEETNDNYLDIQLSEAQDFILNPGTPVLPRTVKTFELPFGATEIDVQVDFSEPRVHHLVKQVRPSPSPLPLSPLYDYQTEQKNEAIYQSADPYPSEQFRFNVGVGLNEHQDRVTFVTVHLYPVQYRPALDTLSIVDKADITVTYTEPHGNPFPQTATYDLAIITPELFSEALQPLVDHKNSYGVETTLKTLENIYSEYDGFDEAEKIKFFIKDAIESWGIQYVLLVGGLNSIIYAKPRDNPNIGVSGWHFPVRYSNVRDGGDPGFPCDLYYADIYKEGGAFEDWDSDEDGVLGEYPDDVIDHVPDVAVGRLAASDATEVSEVVNKIITYETTAYGSDWFKKMVVYSGDGFLDQFDINIQWDTSEIPDGTYFIKAQSLNPEDEEGPIDTIEVTVDKSIESEITFNHDDHLNPVFEEGYPAPPIAEIMTVSNGNILGNSDVTYVPGGGEAYCNDLFWYANISYVDEVLTIRGKTYDPKPYGNSSDIHVWVETDQGETIFEDWRFDMPQYWEGEWVTGEKSVNGRGGALYYMPEEFEKDIIWCSNGRFNGPDDVIESFNEGWGFAFFSGHGSPGYWGDQYPGIPGNRQNGSVDGLGVSNFRLYPPFIMDQPVLPMKSLTNTQMPPITVVGGCHNSLFNVSLIPSMIQYYLLVLFGYNNWMWTYFTAVPQCWSWYMVQLPETGSIATMGNTGLGWGWEGEFCTVGAGDGWISSEFFRQYGDHYGQEDFTYLGHVYQQTQTSYVNTFKDFTLPESWWLPDMGWDSIDAQAVEQWVLLGDPSLKIGGYE